MMNKLKFNIVVVLLMVVCTAMEAREVIERRIGDSFECSANTTFDVSNRFGSISIVNVDADVISVDVVVKVEAASLSKAQHVMDDIDIEIGKIGYKVFAKTVLDASRSGNVKIDIDYVVKMPAYVNTMLKMKYGSVDIDRLTGQFDGEVRYGQLTANSLVCANMGWTNKVSVDYSNGCRIGEIGKLSLDIAYSDIKINKGELLVIESKYSDLKLGDVTRVRGDMAYGDVSMRSVQEVDMEGRYSDFNIELVGRSVSLETAYGEVDIERVGAGFSLVDLEGRYSDLSVGLPRESSFGYTASGKYADIEFPNITIERSSDEGSETYVEGYQNSKDAEARVVIESGYGDVSSWLY